MTQLMQGDCMKMIMDKIFRRKKSRGAWEEEERKMKRCFCLIYENLEASEEELDECEWLIEERRQQIIANQQKR